MRLVRSPAARTCPRLADRLLAVIGSVRSVAHRGSPLRPWSMLLSLLGVALADARVDVLADCLFFCTPRASFCGSEGRARSAASHPCGRSHRSRQRSHRLAVKAHFGPGSTCRANARSVTFGPGLSALDGDWPRRSRSAAPQRSVRDPQLGTAKAAEARRLALQSGDPAAAAVASWPRRPPRTPVASCAAACEPTCMRRTRYPSCRCVFDGQLCITQRLLYGARPYPDVIAFANSLAAEAARLGARAGARSR